MHDSALRIGRKFLDLYFLEHMTSVLEIGSANVNGGLRDTKPDRATWIGVDLEPGPGVDVVVSPGQRLPFEDNYFDLVIASSVFEHDLKFWETISEMARVVKDDGLIYINAPSNGAFHRYPFDAFRFYPDAGISFLSIVKRYQHNALLRESFIASKDAEGWSDCVVVLSSGGATSTAYIHESEEVANLWKNGVFQIETMTSNPETGSASHSELEAAMRANFELLNSKSWRYTKPFRILFGLATRVLR